MKFKPYVLFKGKYFNKLFNFNNSLPETGYLVTWNLQPISLFNCREHYHRFIFL